MKYDTVCMDDACFTTRSSFFTFDPQSVHIKNNHKVKSIHPLTFISCFQKD